MMKYVQIYREWILLTQEQSLLVVMTDLQMLHRTPNYAYFRACVHKQKRRWLLGVQTCCCTKTYTIPEIESMNREESISQVW
jgi:uncharacterized protein YehS (DUF1456 family)